MRFGLKEGKGKKKKGKKGASRRGKRKKRKGREGGEWEGSQTFEASLRLGGKEKKGEKGLKENREGEDIFDAVGITFGNLGYGTGQKKEKKGRQGKQKEKGEGGTRLQALGALIRSTCRGITSVTEGEGKGNKG